MTLLENHQKVSETILSELTKSSTATSLGFFFSFFFLSGL